MQAEFPKKTNISFFFLKRDLKNLDKEPWVEYN